MMRSPSSLLYIGRLQPLWSFYNIKGDTFTLSETFESFAGYGGEMAKNIFSIFLLQKTEPLCVVKPFNLSVYHVLAFSCCFFVPLKPGHV